MNCKPGDLAVVVKADNVASIGRIVRCMSLVPALLVRGRYRNRAADCWYTDVDVTTWDGSLSRYCPDDCLRPIRDQDGEDETMAWAGKPQEVTA
jgi:hypothetical protein